MNTRYLSVCCIRRRSSGSPRPLRSSARAAREEWRRDIVTDSIPLLSSNNSSRPSTFPRSAEPRSRIRFSS